MIQAKVIADSKNEFGNRITTMIVTFPRIILAEFNTHRMFSRNSASSRAIPFEKMLKSVEENPFIPIAWQVDHKGMQGTEYLTAPIDTAMANDLWLEGRDNAIKAAKNLNKAVSLTKQLCNRVLETYMYHTVIVTATEWENFFALRCPNYVTIGGLGFRSRKDYINFTTDDGAMIMKEKSEVEWLQINKGQAEIHMMALAEAMWDAHNESTSKELKAGEWHIPFGDDINIENLIEYSQKNNLLKGSPEEDDKVFEGIDIKIATARCARVSYTVVGEEGKPDNYENDIKLHDRLAASGHWSPAEHCAKAMSKEEYDQFLPDGNPNKGWSGNFKGFIQYRKMFNNENITK